MFIFVFIMACLIFACLTVLHYMYVAEDNSEGMIGTAIFAIFPLIYMLAYMYHKGWLGL